MSRYIRPAFACAAIVTALSLSAAAPEGHGVGRRDLLTFRAPVSLPGVTLVAGTYSFEVVHLDHGDLVRVRFQKTNRLSFEGLTDRMQRPKGMRPDEAVLLAEAPNGGIAKLIAWFPTDELVGYRFVDEDALAGRGGSRARPALRREGYVR